MATTYALTREWEMVSSDGRGTVLLELGRAGGEVEWFLGYDGDYSPGDTTDYPAHRLNSDRPVASLYGLATDGIVVWARSPSTLVESTELIVSEY